MFGIHPRIHYLGVFASTFSVNYIHCLLDRSNILSTGITPKLTWPDVVGLKCRIAEMICPRDGGIHRAGKCSTSFNLNLDFFIFLFFFINSTSFLSGLLTLIYSLWKCWILKIPEIFPTVAVHHICETSYLTLIKRANIIKHFAKKLLQSCLFLWTSTILPPRRSNPPPAASSAQRNGKRSAPFTGPLSNLVRWNQWFISWKQASVMAPPPVVFFTLVREEGTLTGCQ